MMYQSGLACGMSFEMISNMTAGNLVDYILSYTDFHNPEKTEEEKEGKVKMASQVDFDNF